MEYFDQHLHTQFSFDSQEDPENYIEIALQRGVKRLVSTEHVEFDYDNASDVIPDFKAQQALYADLKNKYPQIDFVCGAEIGYKSEKVNDALRIIEKFGLDFINLSVHDYKGIDVYYPEKFAPAKPDDMIRWNLDKIIEAAESDIPYKTLCHVDYAFKSAYSIDKTLRFSDYEDQLIPIFKTLVRRKKALEINTKVQCGIGDDKHTEYLVKTYISVGGKLITLSDDAHRTNSYLLDLNRYLDLLKRCKLKELTFFTDGKPVMKNIDDCYLL